MPHFIQYSIIYLDNQNCNLVFELWYIMSVTLLIDYRKLYVRTG